MRLFPDELREGGDAKRPPRYASRKVQYRLMMLVAMFMFVLLAMDKVRDPRMWQWMWAGEQWAQEPNEATEEPSPLSALTAENVNTQLPPQPSPTAPAIPDAISTAPRPLGQVPDDGGPEQRAADDLWARLVQSLEPAEEKLLDRSLVLHRRQQPLPEESVTAWNAVVLHLQERAERHFKEAQRATEHSTLKEDLQDAWLELLNQQRERWAQRTLPALSSLADSPESRDKAHNLELELIQESLDRLAMANIKDNTVHRAVEGRAWYRMMERLKSADPDDLTADTTERVGFLQLFRQPDIYRGQLVTLHGTAELAYRLKAPENSFGIESYAVIWVRPTGGPSSPVVVYSLGLPDGFPDVVDRDQPGQAAASTTLSEEVDITGYYFKNWAYRSKQGINTAPLMLAKVPAWTPTVSVVPDRGPVTWLQIWIAIASTGLLATVLALLVFRSTMLPRREDADETPLKGLDQFEITSPSEKLAQMSEEESSE